METIVKDGIVYPVLKANNNGYVTCPFCGQKHKHGKGDGHRVADCGHSDKIGYFVAKDGVCDARNGYFIRY